MDNWLLFTGFLLGSYLLSVQRLQHMQSCIHPVLIVVFYVVLWMTGTSKKQGDGWIREMKPAPVWYHTWDYIQLDKVAWEALPDLF
jgi:hypothetical protein